MVDMREEYDFSKGVKNPYAKRLRKSVTMNVDVEAIDYFKNQASASGIPYQTLINLYLLDCAHNNRQLEMKWN